MEASKSPGGHDEVKANGMLYEPVAREDQAEDNRPSTEPQDHVDDEPERRRREKADRKARKANRRQLRAKRKEEKKRRLEERQNVNNRRKRHRKDGNTYHGNDHNGGDGTSAFDQVLTRMKSHKRRRHQISESEAQNRVQNMLQEMDNAATNDEQARARGAPATTKLALLDKVCDEIAKPVWRTWYLQEGVCQQLGTWLSLTPDGELPNLTLRTKILTVLTKMQLNANVMQGTILGHRLTELWRHSEETEANKQMIRSIVHTVLLPLFGLSWSYRAHGMHEVLEEEDPDEQHQGLSSSTPHAMTYRDEPSLAASDPVQATDTAHPRFARVPYVHGHRFKVMPASAVPRRR